MSKTPFLRPGEARPQRRRFALVARQGHDGDVPFGREKRGRRIGGTVIDHDDRPCRPGPANHALDGESVVIDRDDNADAGPTTHAR